ncbi:hypothetical protein FAD39_26040, partial [Escherichia coli]|nr:hypothetical protein [Escherichia coli]
MGRWWRYKWITFHPSLTVCCKLTATASTERRDAAGRNRYFNYVNRASQRKTLMHHLTLKVTTSKMTFNGTMRFNVSPGRLFQYTRLSVVCVNCIKYQR